MPVIHQRLALDHGAWNDCRVTDTRPADISILYSSIFMSTIMDLVPCWRVTDCGLWGTDGGWRLAMVFYFISVTEGWFPFFYDDGPVGIYNRPPPPPFGD